MIQSSVRRDVRDRLVSEVGLRYSAPPASQSDAQTRVEGHSVQEAAETLAGLSCQANDPWSASNLQTSSRQTVNTWEGADMLHNR